LWVTQVREFWSDANNHMVRKKTPKKRERESVCVCVCVWERERERERVLLLFTCITSGLKYDIKVGRAQK
jgi:hypothetical protein